MRNFVDQNLGWIVHAIRVPTRFAMMYLGAIAARPRTAIFLMLFSLTLIAWAYNAPLKLLKSKSHEAENFRTGDVFKSSTFLDRLIWPRVKTGAKHLGAALGMTFGFYWFGKFLF
jgi:hypothetical protein